MAIFTDLGKVQNNNNQLLDYSHDLDSNAINNAIINILTTKIGSVPGMPEFGSETAETVFANIDHITLDLIKTQIKSSLALWETRILVTNVVLKTVPEYNRLIANIDYKYTVKGLAVDGQIAVSLIK